MGGRHKFTHSPRSAALGGLSAPPHSTASNCLLSPPAIAPGGTGSPSEGVTRCRPCGGVACPLPSLAVPCSATQPSSQTRGSSRAPPAPLRPALLSGAAQDAKSTSPWPKNVAFAFWAAKPRCYAHPAAAKAIEDGINITWIFGPPKPRQLCHRWGHLKPPSVAPPSPARG